MRSNGKWVLVTGASTGIGRACVQHLAQLGYHVLAGVRKPADAQSLENDGAVPLLMDVTDDLSMAGLGERVAGYVGDGLCGVVNNAGIGIVGPVEYVAIKDWRRQFDVNVFGHIAVTQAVLPLLRAHVAALGHGAARIIMMGSIGGKVAQPIVGPYTSSKFAIEAISDVLRLELRDQGIHTILLEPGAIQSEIWRKGQESATGIGIDHPARKQYEFLIDRVAARAMQASNQALPASVVARRVAHALTTRAPKARYVIGRDARIAAILKRVLPDSLWDRLMRRALGMP